jgi:ribosome-associated protein
LSYDSLPQDVRLAVEAARNKLALDITVLDLGELRAFTGHFLICSGASTPQVQAIAEEIEGRLEQRGRRALHREGAGAGQWLLLDYGGFVAHIFHEQARRFFDLERLWRSARRIEVPAESQQEAAS